MWCRALLTATLLACTFLRSHAQSQRTKDLLCVLILSGLQKEDLDVALLRKLMRHNVNVHDLDNPSLRKDCLTFEDKTSTRRKGNGENKTLEKLIALNDTIDVVEKKSVVGSLKDDTNNVKNLLKLIKSLKPEKNKTIIKTENNESKPLQSSNVVQFLPTPTAPNSNNDTNSTDFLSILIKRLMAQSTSTRAPTTTTTKTNQFDLASIVKDIKYMIEKRKQNQSKTSTSNPNIKKDDVELTDNKYNMTAYTTDFNPTRSTTKTVPEMPVDVLPPNIIKNIAESVKALVLQDLKKEISTMESIVSNTTLMPATDRDSALIKDATIAFAEFVQLFQQLKTTTTTDRKITAQMKQQTMRALRNPLTASLTTLATGTVIKNSLQNLNRELETIPLYKNSINKIEQLNIFNHKNDVSPPMTIQSNVNQIPPLPVPVIDSPIKMVYQNIIVTSESPFDYFKNVHKNQVFVSNSRTVYNDNKKYSTRIKAPARSDIEIIRDYNTAPRPTHHSSQSEGYGRQSVQGRHQYGRDYHYERFRTPSYVDSYVEYNHRTSYPNYGLRDTRLRNNNIERFHEKLERTNDWSLSSERNHNKFPITSRHLIPFNNRKRQTYDDTHFKNFLKTQQKVNDMLERILATKTGDDGRRIVETT